jgi:hypothetical protein
MLGGGLLVVLGGSLLGAGLAVAAFVVLAASLRADRPRGLRAAKIALGLAVSGVLLTLPIWRVAVTGRGTDGSPCNLWDDALFSSVLLVQAAGLAAALAGLVRRALRPVPSPPR